MDTRKRLARHLRAARLDAGLTQAEVGQALGLHRPAISEIEAGRRSVASEELYELSRLLGVPATVLLSPAEAEAGSPIPDVNDTIDRMARVIAERFHPERIILFGSHARGTASPDSDVDLLVVMEVEGSKRRTGARIGAELHPFRLPKDIVVTTPRAFEARRHVPGTLERTAALEGRVLHVRG
jgi:transcriptional regulator with XRE-family HTH domain